MKKTIILLCYLLAIVIPLLYCDGHLDFAFLFFVYSFSLASSTSFWLTNNRMFICWIYGFLSLLYFVVGIMGLYIEYKNYTGFYNLLVMASIFGLPGAVLTFALAVRARYTILPMKFDHIVYGIFTLFHILNFVFLPYWKISTALRFSAPMLALGWAAFRFVSDRPFGDAQRSCDDRIG